MCGGFGLGGGEGSVCVGDGCWAGGRFELGAVGLSWVRGERSGWDRHLPTASTPGSPAGPEPRGVEGPASPRCPPADPTGQGESGGSRCLQAPPLGGYCKAGWGLGAAGNAPGPALLAGTGFPCSQSSVFLGPAAQRILLLSSPEWFVLVQLKPVTGVASRSGVKVLLIPFLSFN